MKGGTPAPPPPSREPHHPVRPRTGPVRVPPPREESGPGSDELGMFSAEIDTVRNRLATLVASRPRI